MLYTRERGSPTVCFNCRESAALAQSTNFIPHFIIVTLCACALRRPLFSSPRPSLMRGLLQPTYELLSI